VVRLDASRMLGLTGPEVADIAGRACEAATAST
jgi:hypothetical protein